MQDLMLVIVVLVGASLIAIAVLEWRMKFFTNLFAGMSERSVTETPPDTTVADTADLEEVHAEVEQDFWRSFERQIASAERRGDNEEAERLRRIYESHEEAWRAQRALRSRAPSSRDAASPNALQAHLRPEVRLLLERSEVLETFSAQDWVFRGNAYLAIGEDERAAAAYRQALRELPEDPQIRLLYAVALQRDGELRDALQVYDSLLSANGQNDPVVLAGRGNVLADMDRFEDAIRDFDSALSINGQDGDTLYDRARALSDSGRLEDAITGFENARTYLSDNPDLHNDLGNALALSGRNDEALRSYERAIDLRPAFARAHYNRGVTYSRMGRFEEAADAFERCLRLRLDIPEAHYGRGVALARLEQFRDAVAAFDRASVLRPGFADALFHKARAQSRLGQTTEALEALRQAVTASPTLREQARTETDFGALYSDPDVASRFEQLIAS
ncbi:MAG: tetratricopeptide repeat protein [Dehalococcoidia bacterium]|nr:tetratricopeptide repeat protein [Dehalococcoidia bacterium]